MTDSSIAFVVVHAGPNHPESKEVVDIVKKSGVTSISLIEISDDKSKQLLLHNTKGIAITHLPSILVAQTGMQTLVYPGQAINQILEAIRGMVPTT